MHQDPCNGPLYLALTDDAVRADVHALAKRECSKRTSPENSALQAVCNYQHLVLLPLAAPLATRSDDHRCSQLAAGCVASLCLRSPALYEQASVQDANMGHSTADTADAVVKLLWRVLSEPSTVCVPLLSARGVRAFYELFERTFALMYRTRKEMRARVPQDQAQVLYSITHYRPPQRWRSKAQIIILEDLFSSVLAKFKKYRPLETWNFII